MSIVAKIWNNGEFTLGFSSPSKDSPMGLSDASNSVIPASSRRNLPRGRQNVFSSQAKRIVRNGSYLLGHHGRISFVTLTLPPLREGEELLINRQADTLIHRFNRWLTRHLSAAGLPAEIITVREYQKRGALHWHLAFIGCDHPGSWAVSKGEVKAQWSACLGNLLGREVNCDAATRIERVRKDVGRYLSKYMSKSNTASQPTSDDPFMDTQEEVLPAGRAWNISNTLRRRIKVIRSEVMGLLIWNHRGELPFVWLREFEWEGKVMGLVGQLPWEGSQCRHQLEKHADMMYAIH